MKRSIFKLLILLNLFLVNAYGQEIVTNTCDSTLLTQEEFEKCKLDSVSTADILIKTNYIIKFKTSLLPKYRLLRRSLNIPSTLQKALQQLKTSYNTVLNRKLSVYPADMDRNQSYVQPKTYLSSILSFQILTCYPDSYAVLLNDIHLQLKPKTTSEEQKQYKMLFDQAIKSIPADLYQKLNQITKELSVEDAQLMEQGITKIFQGSIQDDYRSRCNVINFLLWTA